MSKEFLCKILKTMKLIVEYIKSNTVRTLIRCGVLYFSIPISYFTQKNVCVYVCFAKTFELLIR